MATFSGSLMTLFSEEDFLSWGWRIPFLLSSVLVLLGLFIVPWFMLLDTGTHWGIVLATVVAFGILWAPLTAVPVTLCSEIFSANVR